MSCSSNARTRTHAPSLPGEIARKISDCLDRLATYAETDYVIIFFAEPMEHAPPLSWMYNAYKSLERK